MATRDTIDDLAVRNPLVDRDALRKATDLVRQLRQIGINPHTFNLKGPQTHPKARPVDRDDNTRAVRLPKKMI